MPRGSKAKYTTKQKRQARHIEESYERKGLSPRKVEERAWRTVNKISGGGEKKGGGTKVSAASKKEARHESGVRAAASRKLGSRKVQKRPPRKRTASRG